MSSGVGFLSNSVQWFEDFQQCAACSIYLMSLREGETLRALLKHGLKDAFTDRMSRITTGT
jgi:hypothetical protein